MSIWKNWRNCPVRLKVTDARRRSRRVKGFITGGAVGALVGLLAGPVGWAALGGSAVGMLAGRVAGSSLRQLMADLGESLTPDSSAIVAVIEHRWVDLLEQELAAEGARVVREALKQDIAEQLQAGGNVLYTVGGGANVAGAARVMESPTGTQVSGLIASADGIFIGGAQITDEQPTTMPTRLWRAASEGRLSARLTQLQQEHREDGGDTEITEQITFARQFLGALCVSSVPSV